MQVDAQSVEVNALRATLGAKPLPYPAAGVVRGSMQCYGALDEPIFNGRIEAVSAPDGMIERGPAGDAQQTLLRSRRQGPAPALVTYDKVAAKCVLAPTKARAICHLSQCVHASALTAAVVVRLVMCWRDKAAARVSCACCSREEFTLHTDLRAEQAVSCAQPCCRAGYAHFTFNTGSGIALLSACELTPLHGGQFSAAGRMALDPDMEHDPGAIQVDFSGSNLDVSAVGAYLGEAANMSALKEATGTVAVTGKMSGAHSAPVTQLRLEAPAPELRALVQLTRDKAALRVRAPSLDFAASVLTEFPSYDTQKQVVTQEDAIAMRQPRYVGGNMLADARAVDIAPLLRAAQSALDSSGAGAGLPEASPVVINGKMDVFLREVQDEHADLWRGGDFLEPSGGQQGPSRAPPGMRARTAGAGGDRPLQVQPQMHAAATQDAHAAALHQTSMSREHTLGSPWHQSSGPGPLQHTASIHQHRPQWQQAQANKAAAHQQQPKWQQPERAEALEPAVAAAAPHGEPHSRLERAQHSAAHSSKHAAAVHADHAHCAAAADEQEAGEEPVTGPSGRFVGDLKVSAARVNQLSLINNLEGGFTVSDGRLKLHAAGRSAREKVHIDADVGALAQALQRGDIFTPSAEEGELPPPDATAQSAAGRRAASSDQPASSTAARARSGAVPSAAAAAGDAKAPQDGTPVNDSMLEFRHGSMQLRAHVRNDLRKVRLQAQF